MPERGKANRGLLTGRRAAQPSAEPKGLRGQPKAQRAGTRVAHAAPRPTINSSAKEHVWAKEMPAGHAIVAILKAEGVRAVYGIPGGHVLPIYDGLYDTADIRHFLVRHEQAAASMAAGYAQLTGETAVCLVTAGPGATNLATNVAEAFVGALPMVILAGRGATATTYRGASQEVDTDQLFRPITKWADRIDRADLIPEALREAFAVARNGKPGPVYLDLPRDILQQRIKVDHYVPAGPASRPRGEAARIEAAVDLLLDAKLPLIVAGGGTIASGAAEPLRQLAEALSAPVITTLSGRGSIDDDHPLSVGGLGVHRNPLSKRLLAQADVVLALGARFEEMETNWRPGFLPSPAARTIHVDIDAAEIGRSVPAEIGIIGDICAVLEDLLAVIRTRKPARLQGARPEGREDAYAAEIKELAKKIEQQSDCQERPIHPLRVIRAARQALPRQATVAIDVGCLAQHMVGSLPAFPVHLPRSLIVPSSFYGMGFAGSALPVARQVYPERPAVGFVGDGSFQMILHVLPMAAEYRLGVTWCVLNDRSLGSIRDIQEFGLNNRIIDTDFGVQPDFAKIAEACGCYGEQVTDPEAVDGAIARALAVNETGVPAVLDFIVARARMQQTYEHYTFYGRH
jgi:acetolactate synthase I/II/III large subunit